MIHLIKGNTLDLSAIRFMIKDAYTPRITVPCYVAPGAYSIADTSIARISGGKIEGLKAGETTITASSGGLSASAALVVTEDSTIPLRLNTPVSIDIAAGETVLFSFTPSETGKYVFYSTGSSDTYGYLYDSNMTVLAYNDDANGSYNFSVSYELSAGTKYYFGARLYSSDATGSTTVTLEKDTDFTYSILPDGTASITGCKLTGDIVIPDSLDGLTVSNLAAELFFGRSDITSVTIPATVTYFGEDSSDNDWDYVFSYCYSLQNIFVDSGNPSFKSIDGVLFSKDGNTLINYPCAHAGEVYHVTARKLCCTAFASCGNLRFLFLDDPNTTWFTYTFYNTGLLTSFYLRGGATERKVENDTQSSCSFVPADEIVRLPASLGTIEAEAFQNTAIWYLIVPDSCTRIQAGAFGGTLAFAQVGASTVIESGAFADGTVIERR